MYIYIYIQLYTLEKSFLQVGKCGLETPNVLSKNLAKEVTSILRTWPWDKKMGYIPRMPQIRKSQWGLLEGCPKFSHTAVLHFLSSFRRPWGHGFTTGTAGTAGPA